MLKLLHKERENKVLKGKKQMTNWQPNEKQTRFMQILKDNPDGLTLAEASEIAGYEIKSGSINTLTNKKLVETTDVEIKCDIVASDNHDKVLGHTTKKVKAYHLVQKD